MDDLTQGLPRRLIGRGLAFEEVDEPVEAEHRPSGVAGLGDAVGVEDDGVLGLEPLLLHLAFAAAQPEGQPSGAGEGLDHSAAAQHQRMRMPRGQIAQPAGVQVELGEDPGGEPLPAEPLGEDVIDHDGGVEQAPALPAAVAVRGQRDRGDDARVQGVAHGVEDGQVHPVGVGGVVEGVSAHVVGGLEDTADHQPVVAEGQWWEQLPEQLRGHGVGALAPHPVNRVAVGGLDVDQVSEQARDRPERVVQRGVVGIGAGGQRDVEYAEALHSVEQRQPQPGRVGILDWHRLDQAERPPGQRSRDRQRRPGWQAGGRPRYELALVVVDEVDDDAHAEAVSGGRGQVGQLVRRGQMRGIDQGHECVEGGLGWGSGHRGPFGRRVGQAGSC